MPNEQLNFTVNLRKSIHDSGLHHSKIAKHVGVSANTLTNWMNGKTFPAVDEVIRLAEILKITDYNWLFTGTKSDQAPCQKCSAKDLEIVSLQSALQKEHDERLEIRGELRECRRLWDRYIATPVHRISPHAEQRAVSKDENEEQVTRRPREGIPEDLQAARNNSKNLE